MNRYVYHYSCHYQLAYEGVSFIDGIATTTERIICIDSYRRFKKRINCPDTSIVTVDSLSFLGMEDDTKS